MLSRYRRVNGSHVSPVSAHVSLDLSYFVSGFATVPFEGQRRVQDVELTRPDNLPSSESRRLRILLACAQ